MTSHGKKLFKIIHRSIKKNIFIFNTIKFSPRGIHQNTFVQQFDTSRIRITILALWNLIHTRHSNRTNPIIFRAEKFKLFGLLLLIMSEISSSFVSWCVYEPSSIYFYEHVINHLIIRKICASLFFVLRKKFYSSK